nr:MAG TPA: hypothetical protein [Caudoviricetes sp.]
MKKAPRSGAFPLEDRHVIDAAEQRQSQDRRKPRNFNVPGREKLPLLRRQIACFHFSTFRKKTRQGLRSEASQSHLPVTAVGSDSPTKTMKLVGYFTRQIYASLPQNLSIQGFVPDPSLFGRIDYSILDLVIETVNVIAIANATELQGIHIDRFANLVRHDDELPSVSEALGLMLIESERHELSESSHLKTPYRERSRIGKPRGLRGRAQERPSCEGS